MKRITFLFMCLLFVSASWAQNIQVSGVVTDASDGQPLPGALVLVKGTKTTAITDVNGHFTITAPADASLEFSFANMKTTVVPVNGRTTVDIVLEADVRELEEVLVIAYGVAKKNTYTGSAQAVKAEVIEKRQSANISTALQGSVAGVQVINNTAQPGEAANIRIRGIGSLNVSSEPLWVVDGVPYSGFINSLNQEDIESMTVLKDAASTALYGARAANGVILVTTKKGKQGKPSISFKATWGISDRAVKEYEKLGAAQQMEMDWEAYRNYLIGKTSIIGALTPEQYASKNQVTQRTKYNPVFMSGVPVAEPVGTDGKIAPGTTLMWDENWFDALTRTPLRQDYQLAVSGGVDKTTYMLSLGYLDEEGVTIESGFKRYNARTTVDVELQKWLSTGLILATAYTKSDFPLQESSSFINPYIFSRTMSNLYPVYRRNADGSIMNDADGNAVFDTGDWQAVNMRRPVASGSNPVAAIKYQATKYSRWAIDPTWFVNINFTPWLSLRTNVSVNYWNEERDQSYSRLLGDAKGLGRIYKYRNSYLSLTANEVLTFSNVFADIHSVSFMLGHESTSTEYNYLYGQKTGTYDDDIPEWDMASTMEAMSSRTDELAREGYFGRIAYDYDGKYFVEGSYRKDASSRFYKDNRWGDFWSASLGWRIVRENFMQSLSFIHDLKLRASYGVQGNDAFSSWFPYMGTASASGWSYTGLPGFYYNQMENKKLTWEKNTALNIGIDYNFWGRLYGSLEYFHRTTSDMLFALPLAPSDGFTTYNTNAGEMVNQGIELDVTGDIYKNRKIEVRASLNMSYLKNEITELPFKEKVQGTKKWMVGHDPYSYYIYEYAGVDPANGEALYWADVKDASGNPTGERKTVNKTANATQYYNGTALPKVQLGFSPYFRGYGFDVSLTITGQFGHKIFDSAYQSLMHDGYRSGYVWSKDILNRWTPTNTNTDVPKVYGESVTEAAATSSRFLYNGDFLRFRALTIGYTIPKKWTDKINVKNVRVFIQADNFATLKIGNMPDGTDPEVLDGVQGYNSTASRIFSGGINITL